MTALILASQKGYKDIVEIFVKSPNIDINAKSRVNFYIYLLFSIVFINVYTKKKTRKTALIYAVSEGHEEVVKVLIDQLNIDIRIRSFGLRIQSK